MGDNRDPRPFEARLADADRALSANPRDLRALIAKGGAWSDWGMRGPEPASTVRPCGAPRAASPCRPMRRAQTAVQDQGARFQSYLAESLARSGFDAATSSDRFALSLDLMAGRKRLYQQEPRF